MALDQKIVALAQSIRDVESGGNYAAKGKSGEAGAYQFTRPTWQAWAGKHLGDANAPLTRENQNKVAYKQIEEWKGRGFTPAQIAAAWNAGEGALDGDKWKTLRGVNKFGAEYDTPGYVEKVRQRYMQYKPQDAAQPIGGAPVAYAAQSEQPTEPEQPIYKKLGSFFGGDVIGDAIGAKIAQGAFGDRIQKAVTGMDLTPEQEAYVQKGPTSMQIAGDMGRVALNFAPIGRMVGGAAKVAQGLGASAKAARVVGNIAAPAAAGYAYDVAESTAQGDTSFKPGMGTYFGGGLGLAGTAAGATVRGLAARSGQSRMEDLVRGGAELSRALEKNTKYTYQGGKRVVRSTPLQTFEKHGMTPYVVDGKIQTDHIQVALQEKIDEVAQSAREALKTSNHTVPLNSFAARIRSSISNDQDLRNLGKVDAVLKQANTIIASYKKTHGNSLPVTAIDDIRMSANRVWKDDVAVRDVYRVIGDVSRNVVYDAVPDQAIKKMLQYEADLIAASNFAERLQGKAVKGGRLGAYFSKIGGTGAGAVAGSMFGGPVATAVGAAVGGYAANKFSKLGQSMYFKPPLANTARRIVSAIDGPLTPGDYLANNLTQRAPIAATRLQIRNAGQEGSVPVRNTRAPLLLGPGATPMPAPKPAPSGVRLVAAKSIMQPDPQTGVMKKVYTQEPENVSVAQTKTGQEGSSETATYTTKKRVPKKFEKKWTATDEEMENTRQQIAVLEGVLHDHPAKKLMKYQLGRYNHSLAEINYKALGTKRKAALLDDYVTEVGYKDMEDAETGIEEYRQMKKEVNELRDYLRDLKKQKRTGEDVFAYDDPKYYGSEAFAGAALGTELERDENGNVTGIGYNTQNALLGAAGIVGARRAKNKLAKIAQSTDDALVREARKYKSAEEFVKKFYTEPTYDLTPGTTRMSAEGFAETGLYHGGSNVQSILNDGKIKANVSRLDKAGEKVVSLTKSRGAADSYGIVFELDEKVVKHTPAPEGVVLGDGAKNFEYRATEDIPLSSVKSVTIPLNRGEGLQQKILTDFKGKEPVYQTAEQLAKQFESRGIKVFFNDGRLGDKKHLTDIWKKANGK